VAVVCSLHQIHLARAYADRIVGLVDGQIVADVEADEFDTTAFARVYGSNGMTPAGDQPKGRIENVA